MPLMDPSTIINEVKKNPILYDHTLGDYKNVPKKKSVWEAIAKRVGAVNGEMVSWKWKNLRDSYAKYKKIILLPYNELGPKSKLLKWRWAPMLTFLDPFLRKPKIIIGASRHTEDNDDAESKNDDEESVEFEARLNDASQDSSNISSSPICSSIKTECTDSVINITDTTINVTDTGNKFKIRAMDSIDEVLIDYPQEGPSHRLDMTDYMFLNYAETFKKLSRRRQALLKVEMATMFAAAELEELENDPIGSKVHNEDSD